MLRLGRRLGLRLRSSEQRLQLRLRLRLPASFVAKTTWTWAWDEYCSPLAAPFVAGTMSTLVCVCRGVYVAVCVCGCVWSCVLLSGSLYQGLGLPWLGLALRSLWLPHFAFTTYAFYVFTVLCPLCVCVSMCVCGQGQHEEGRRRWTETGQQLCWMTLKVVFVSTMHDVHTYLHPHFIYPA